MLIDTPLNLRTFTVHDRLVLPPMATEKSQGEGLVSQELCDYYNDKTKSGAFGLVITEHSYVSKMGQASVHQVSCASDFAIPGLSRLVDVIHRNGSKVIAQINHAGGKGIIGLQGSSESLAPTGMEYTTTRGEKIRSATMDQADIDEVIKDFAQAARRAKEAGYDGVEIHSAHGYLLNQFYSPLTNKRNDVYTGATIQGRTRLHCQIIDALRQTVGNDYLVAIRLGACDYEPGGSSVEDAVLASRIFEAAGVDLIDVSGGLCGYRGRGSQSEGYFGVESQAIRAVVKVPVMLTGGVKTGHGAEDLLEEGKADLIGVGRAVLKDSEWPRKAFAELGL